MNDLHLSRVDLNLLVSLDTLLRVRSVSVAARQLGLSQSAMSHQLRRLREMFGDPLLASGKGGMVATPLAESLEGPVRRALGELGRAIRGEVGFDPRTAERTFVIATKDVVEVIGLPPLLDLISREAPGVRADVRPITSGTPAALQEGAVDLVIGPDLEAKFGARLPGVRTQALSTDDFVCIVREGHPALGGELDLETFLSLRHVVVTSDPTNDAPIEHAVHTLGRVRDVAARIAHFMSVPFVVGQSDLVATIPRRMADTFARLARLRVLSPPPSLDLPQSELVMSWHERCNEDPANRWLREVAARLSHLVDETCSASDDHDRPDGVVSKGCSRQAVGPR
jgi:DNA-binding transcriptional LysR family regulator